MFCLQDLKELEFAVKEVKEIQETSTEGDKSGDELYVSADLLKLAGAKRPSRGLSAHPIDVAAIRAEGTPAFHMALLLKSCRTAGADDEGGRAVRKRFG